MPVTYEIDHTTGIIRTKCFGRVVLEDVLDHFRTLQCDPECPERLDVLLDLSASESAASSGQLRTVAHAIAAIRDRVTFDACAIVAPTDLLFGIARMFEVFAQEHFRATHVFRSARDAEAWLGSQLSRDAGGSGG